MKRTLALILSLLLLFTVTAVADALEVLKNENDEVIISKYDSDGTTGTYKTTPEVNTQIWLQVDATGQIDVTVPLILVFSTNIDGGPATPPTDYGITNNSSAAIAVTSISAAREGTAAGSQPMTMIAFATDFGDNLDQYKAQLTATTEWKDKDLFVTSAYTANASAGGLFSIANGGTEQSLTVDFETSKLSFVTARNTNDAMDETKGIKLLTITYTVAIDTSDTISGSTIPTTNETFTGIQPTNP